MNIDFVIITALEEERDALHSKLQGVQKVSPTDDDIRVYFKCELPVTYPNGTQSTYTIVTLSLLGMGRLQALNATKDAISRWSPRYVLLVGIAGGVEQNEVSLGDILVSDLVVDYELQKVRETSESFRFQPHNCDPRLVGAAQNFLGDSWTTLVSASRPEEGKPKRHIGPVATGDKVVERKSLVAQLLNPNSWPKLIGIEMEAGGAASGCFQSVGQPGFFMVRGVSDLADEDKETESVKAWREYACDIAAAYTIALLKSGPVPHVNQVQQTPAVNKSKDELRNYTERTLQGVRLHIPGIAEVIPRSELNLIEDQLQLKRPVLLTGEPGTGKTGVGSMLISSARRQKMESLLLDARRVEHVRDESQLRQHLSLREAITVEIERIARQEGFRLVIDQLDSAVGLPSSNVLTELAIACSDLTGVQVVVISRSREGHESKLLSKLTSVGFVELESRKLEEATARDILSRLGIHSPTSELLTLSQNFLNLELIGKLSVEKAGVDFSKIADEVELWEMYVSVLTEREGIGSGDYQPEQIIADAVDLAKQGLESEDSTFLLSVPLSHSLIRLSSWGVITPEFGRVYRFSHEKLQDYFYAWDATERRAMPRDVINEINPHRSRNVLEWMRRIYARHAPVLYKQFLKEAFSIDV